MAGAPSSPFQPNPSATPPPEASGCSTGLRHKISCHPRNPKQKKGLPPHQKYTRLPTFASQRPRPRPPARPAARSRSPRMASPFRVSTPNRRLSLPPPTLRDKIKILPTMERASKLIRGLRLSGDVITPEQLCCAAWPEAVGKKIAGHTRPAKLVRSPPGGGSRGPHLAAPVVRPDSAHLEQPGEDAGARPGGGPGVPHRAPPARPGAGAAGRARRCSRTTPMPSPTR